MKTCPNCNGKKKTTAHFPRYSPEVPEEMRKASFELACMLCNGSGEVSDVVILRSLAGAALRKDRLARKMSLRKEAARLGVSPTALSQVEQGNWSES